VFGEQFEHEMIMQLAGARTRGRFSLRSPEHTWVKDVRRRIETFERHWRHWAQPAAPKPLRTVDFFGNLQGHACDEMLEKMYRDRGTSAASRVVLTVGEGDFAVTSCAVNRFLVARLAKQERLEVYYSKIDDQCLPVFSTAKTVFLEDGAGVVAP